MLIAGFAALSGFRHGANVFKVEAMVNELERGLTFEKNLRLRLDRGEQIYGFGHNLYPEGDFRAKVLLDKIQQKYTSNAKFEILQKIKHLCCESTNQEPNIDFAFLTLATVLGQTAEFSFLLFALGRMVGWIGHTIEEYNDNRLIRPRAKYIGPKP